MSAFPTLRLWCLPFHYDSTVPQVLLFCQEPGGRASARCLGLFCFRGDAWTPRRCRGASGCELSLHDMHCVNQREVQSLEKAGRKRPLTVVQTSRVSLSIPCPEPTERMCSSSRGPHKRTVHNEVHCETCDLPSYILSTRLHISGSGVLDCSRGTIITALFRPAEDYQKYIEQAMFPQKCRGMLSLGVASGTTMKQQPR